MAKPVITTLLRHRPLVIAALVAGSSVLGAFGLGYFADPVPAPVLAKPVSADHGRQMFIQSCAHCHGDDARGHGEDGDGPDLYRLAIGNARISAVIRTGIPEEMPSFVKKHGPADIADLTAFLRTLR